jgi:hypothetical protein
LDGTLVDSVYQRVLSWREALECCGIELSVWRIHRRIGMSGGLFNPGKSVESKCRNVLQKFLLLLNPTATPKLSAN